MAIEWTLEGEEGVLIAHLWTYLGFYEDGRLRYLPPHRSYTTTISDLIAAVKALRKSDPATYEEFMHGLGLGPVSWYEHVDGYHTVREVLEEK